MTGFNEFIKEITDGMIQDGTIDEIIRKKVRKGFEEGIEHAFLWGDLRHAIEQRIQEVLVPYIEGYDMGKYITKLDTVLSDIVNQTTLQDNTKILENFKMLMTEPDETKITLEEILKEYGEHVSMRMSTTGRPVNYDNEEPCYEPMGITARIIKDEDRPWGSFEWATLELAVDEEDQEDELNFSIRLMRWKHDREEGYEFSQDEFCPVNSLKRLEDFEVYVLRLSRARARLIDDGKEHHDLVYSKKSPEITYK